MNVGKLDETPIEEIKQYHRREELLKHRSVKYENGETALSLIDAMNIEFFAQIEKGKRPKKWLASPQTYILICLTTTPDGLLHFRGGNPLASLGWQGLPIERSKHLTKGFMLVE